MKPDKRKIYTVPDVQQLLGCCYETARKLVHDWNMELRAQGFVVFRGVIPRKYVEERLGL